MTTLIEKYDPAVFIRTSQLASCHPFDSPVPEEFWGILEGIFGLFTEWFKGSCWQFPSNPVKVQIAAFALLMAIAERVEGNFLLNYWEESSTQGHIYKPTGPAHSRPSSDPESVFALSWARLQGHSQIPRPCGCALCLCFVCLERGGIGLQKEATKRLGFHISPAQASWVTSGWFLFGSCSSSAEWGWSYQPPLLGYSPKQ